MALKSRTGGQLIVDQLLVHGVKDIFCVPGESYLAVLDALHDADVRITVCRQEAGACMAAEAVGKLTGRPGICMVMIEVWKRLLLDGCASKSTFLRTLR